MTADEKLAEIVHAHRCEYCQRGQRLGSEYPNCAMQMAREFATYILDRALSAVRSLDPETSCEVIFNPVDHIIEGLEALARDIGGDAIVKPQRVNE